MTDDRIDRDFDALSKVTDLPAVPLSRFVENGASQTETRKERTMFFSSVTPNRRFIVAPAAALLIAAILFIVPVSYRQTVGFDVSLSVEGAAAAPGRIESIARELKTALGVDGVRVSLEQRGDGGLAKMSTYVDATSHSNPELAVSAFAKYLNEKGIKTSAKATARRKEVSSNVFAMTLDRVIRVEMGGKTDREIEMEIENQLEAAGIDNFEVTVQRDGDERTRIEIRAECEDDRDGGCPQVEPRFVLTKNGKSPSEQGRDRFVRVRKKIAESAEVTTIELGIKGDRVTLELMGADDMAEDSLIASVESQLKEQGVDWAVKIADGALFIGETRIDCFDLD